MDCDPWENSGKADRQMATIKRNMLLVLLGIGLAISAAGLWQQRQAAAAWEAANEKLATAVLLVKADGSALIDPATSGLQTTGNASLASIDGKMGALPTGSATAALQSAGNATLTTIDGKLTACNTGAVVVAGSALPAGASTAALQTSGNASLASLLASQDYVVSAEYTATLGATATIPTAFTATLPANTVRIILLPRGDVYYKIGGAASASTAKVAEGGLNMPCTKTLADTIQVFGSTVVCDLLVCTPR